MGGKQNWKLFIKYILKYPYWCCGVCMDGRGYDLASAR